MFYKRLNSLNLWLNQHQASLFVCLFPQKVPKDVRTKLGEAFIVTNSLSSEDSTEGWKEASIIQLLKKLLEPYQKITDQ